MTLGHILTTAGFILLDVWGVTFIVVSLFASRHYIRDAFFRKDDDNDSSTEQ